MSMFGNKKDENLTPEEILAQYDKGIGRTTGVLAKLWRLILSDLKIGPMAYEQLMQKYLRRKRNTTTTPTKRISDKGNINKNVFKDNITLDLFLKAMDVIGVTNIKFTVEIEREGHEKKSSHSITISGVSNFIKPRKPRQPGK